MHTKSPRLGAALLLAGVVAIQSTARAEDLLVVAGPARDQRIHELERAYGQAGRLGPALMVGGGASLVFAGGVLLALTGLVDASGGGDCAGPCSNDAPVAMYAVSGATLAVGVALVGAGLPWMLHRRHVRTRIRGDLDVLRAPVLSVTPQSAMLTWRARF